MQKKEIIVHYPTGFTPEEILVFHRRHYDLSCYSIAFYVDPSEDLETTLKCFPAGCVARLFDDGLDRYMMPEEVTELAQRSRLERA